MSLFKSREQKAAENFAKERDRAFNKAGFQGYGSFLSSTSGQSGAERATRRDNIATKPERTEYMCSWCGERIIRFSSVGKPLPGDCPRRKMANGTYKPHVWVVNRKF